MCTYMHAYIHSYIHTYIHTYRQTDRQTDRQIKKDEEKEGEREYVYPGMHIYQYIHIHDMYMYIYARVSLLASRQVKELPSSRQPGPAWTRASPRWRRSARTGPGSASQVPKYVVALLLMIEVLHGHLGKKTLLLELLGFWEYKVMQDLYH